MPALQIPIKIGDLITGVSKLVSAVGGNGEQKTKQAIATELDTVLNTDEPTLERMRQLLHACTTAVKEKFAIVSKANVLRALSEDYANLEYLPSPESISRKFSNGSAGRYDFYLRFIQGDNVDMTKPGKAILISVDLKKPPLEASSSNLQFLELKRRSVVIQDNDLVQLEGNTNLKERILEIIQAQVRKKTGRT